MDLDIDPLKYHQNCSNINSIVAGFDPLPMSYYTTPEHPSSSSSDSVRSANSPLDINFSTSGSDSSGGRLVESPERQRLTPRQDDLALIIIEIEKDVRCFGLAADKLAFSQEQPELLNSLKKLWFQISKMATDTYAKLKEAQNFEVTSFQKMTDAKLAEDLLSDLLKFQKAQCVVAERQVVQQDYREFQKFVKMNHDVNEMVKDLTVLVHEQRAIIDDSEQGREPIVVITNMFSLCS